MPAFFLRKHATAMTTPTHMPMTLPDMCPIEYAEERFAAPCISFPITSTE